MTRDQILKQINEIFVDVLERDDILINETTKATDIDEWDSLMHVLLVDEMEDQFNIQFKSKEIQNWKNIGEIIDSIINEA